MQAEAERRLGQAKRAAPAGRPRPSPAKRSRPTAVSSDEELSEQEGSEGDGNADMVRLSSSCLWNKFLMFVFLPEVSVGRQLECVLLGMA